MTELSKETLTGQAKCGFSVPAFFALPPRLIVFHSLSIGTTKKLPTPASREPRMQFSLDSLHREVSQLDRINVAGCVRSKVSNCAKNRWLEDLDRIPIVDAPEHKFVFGQIAQQT